MKHHNIVVAKNERSITMRKESNTSLQITISKDWLKVYEANAKKRGYQSKSEYIRALLFLDNEKIRKENN